MAAAKTLEEKIEFRISQLNEYYPDKVITNLGRDHKKLAEALGKMWKEKGCASLDEFLEAYGFRVERSKGGRTAGPSAEELFVELRARYEGKELPTGMKELVEQNLDLKGRIKTFSNDAKKNFGASAVEVLLKEGILAEKPVAEKPVRQPRPTKFTIEKDEFDKLFEGITQEIVEKPNDEKPETITKLQELYPEQSEAIKFAQKNKFLDRNELGSLGVLKATRALLKREGVYKAKPELIADDFKALVGKDTILPSDDFAKNLPPTILGVDIANQIELREIEVILPNAKKHGLSAGQKLDEEISEEQNVFDTPYSVLKLVNANTQQIVAMDRANYVISDVVEPLGNGLAEGSSELDAYVCGEVIEVYPQSDAAAVRVRCEAPLRIQTLVYALRKLGIVAQSDLKGDMAWRYRLKKAAEAKC